jgi:TPR repeat protein
MNIKKIITRLTLSMLLGSGTAVALDFDKGLKAAQSGDFKTALAEWTPLAEQGDADAQNNLGSMYDGGYGVRENDKIAVKWYTLAADQDHANAQYNLGFMYDYGRGVLENDNTAVKWYTLAARQGNATAQDKLGFMYQYGEGVLTDTKRAYMWYNIGAYNGNDLGAENKSNIAKNMTLTQIDTAQDMSSRCLESNYTDC